MPSRFSGLMLALCFFPAWALGAEPADCKVTAHFPRDESLGKVVTAALRRSRTNAKVALYGFNNPALAEELLDLARRNVAVELKIDTEKSGEKKTGRLLERMKAGGIKVQTVAPGGRNHNKFAVVDGVEVVTGSYNWTAKAESNWENLLVLRCPQIAREYEREWERIH